MVYPPSKKIRVDDENNIFFAFNQEDKAIRVAMAGGKKWRTVGKDLLVLPVTMYEVTSTGQLHSRSNDLQCLDSYYDAYESKEIIVHDSKEIRLRFYRKVMELYCRDHRYTMSHTERKAFESISPFLGQSLKLKR